MNFALLRRIAAPSLLLIAVIFICYGTPRETRYVSTNVLKQIALPDTAGRWQGVDIDEKLNLGQGYYSYLGSLRTRKYTDQDGNSIFVTLMDAGNFHHPKLCFQGAGYTPEDMPDTPITAVSGTFNAPTIYFKKEHINTLVLYWLCIDKHRVSWAQQKTQDLWNTILGKRRVGLIVRLDIFTPQEKIPVALKAAKDLLLSINQAMPPSQAAYVFGE